MLKQRMKNIILPEEYTDLRSIDRSKKSELRDQGILESDQIEAKQLSLNQSSDLSGVTAPFKITGT